MTQTPAVNVEPGKTGKSGKYPALVRGFIEDSLSFLSRRKKLSSGEGELSNQRNPFYVDKIRGVTCVISAIVVATLIYGITVLSLKAHLVSSIRAADMLTAVLQLSPLYPESSSTIATSTKSETRVLVNDLAIATWLQNFKLVPPDATIDDILRDEDRLGLLIKALRYGGHCDASPRGKRQPLFMPTVERLAGLGEFLSENCNTRSGDGISRRLANELADRIAEGGFSGKDLFKYALTENAAYDGLNKELGATAPDDPSVEEAATVLKRDDALLREASPDPATKKAADPKLDEIKKRRDESEKRLIEAKNKSADSSADLAASYQARAFLNRLYKLKIAQAGKDAPSESPLTLIESFAISLIASIDADPAVTKARQWLSAVWGMEQYLIFTLFLITASLMVERNVTFNRYRLQVVSRIGELSNAIAANQNRQPPQTAEQGEAPQSSHRRQIERDVQAETARQRLLTEALKPVSEASDLVNDLLRATRSDLSQVRLFGLSDERVDKVAEDLKDKIEASRLIIQWGVTTLPALGFLGTVRGILIALSAIGGLSQGDSAARLGALLSVSSALGLAFATTLFALVFLIFLSYFDIRQARDEKALVDAFRDFLNDKILP